MNLTIVAERIGLPAKLMESCHRSEGLGIAQRPARGVETVLTVAYSGRV
jgi:hypothetical protein